MVNGLKGSKGKEKGQSGQGLADGVGLDEQTKVDDAAARHAHTRSPAHGPYSMTKLEGTGLSLHEASRYVWIVQASPLWPSCSGRRMSSPDRPGARRILGKTRISRSIETIEGATRRAPESEEEPADVSAVVRKDGRRTRALTEAEVNTMTEEDVKLRVTSRVELARVGEEILIKMSV